MKYKILFKSGVKIDVVEAVYKDLCKEVLKMKKRGDKHILVENGDDATHVYCLDNIDALYTEGTL